MKKKETREEEKGYRLKRQHGNKEQGNKEKGQQEKRNKERRKRKRQRERGRTKGGSSGQPLARRSGASASFFIVK